MDIRKIDVSITEEDVAQMVSGLFEKQELNKNVNLTQIFTELLLQNPQACTYFVQVILGKNLPQIHSVGSIVRVPWKNISLLVDNSEKVYEELKNNNLLNKHEEVTCTVEEYRGLLGYFQYRIRFKYNDKDSTVCSATIADIKTYDHNIF